MVSHEYALFDTALGRTGIAWSEHGVAMLQLPEASEAQTRRRILVHWAAAREAPPSPEIERAIRAVTASLEGERSDLRSITLDMRGVLDFHRRVYVAARAIAPGTTLTYGELARRIGAAGSARAVGQALGRNPFAIIVPCHRVVAAGGKLGGFSASGGASTKQRLLAIEGALTRTLPLER